MWFLLFATALSATPNMVAPGQALRRIELNPADGVHMVEVVGALNMMTTLQLPDDFEASNVRCGACVLLGADTQANGTDTTPDSRNWAIEVRPQERNVHLRPTHVPTLANPPALFATNVFITLNSGQAINVRLRLWDPAQDATAHPDADATVTLHMPHTALISGRLAEQKQRLEQEQARQSAAWAQRWLLTHMDGELLCHRTSFARPYRTDKTVVRIHRLCRLNGPKTQTYWALYNVENDGATPLAMQDAILEPQRSAVASSEPMPAYFSAERLAFGEGMRAIALYVSPTGSEQPERFVLRVTPADTERRPVEIQDVVFP